MNKKGYTVLEVMIAIFIFGCIGATLLKLTYNIEKFRGKTFFIENATKLASDEAERLRFKAALNVLPELDSVYEVTSSGRTFRVERRIKKKDAFIPDTLFLREPLEIEIYVAESRGESSDSLKFRILTGIDRP
ncbi:MAG: prepilin-type N-terminal cleavage/methylation domain-containing protein [Chitinispirillaceae bacterium]|nr:prepilin-type N-terminal cleavage/methylation domain-containing protein [Chitinispirillaceae bacterium]